MRNGKNRKMNLEKLRKRTKKNWKREMWSEYRHVMQKAKWSIDRAINTWCYVRVKPENHFIAWLVARKLKAEGFKCNVSRPILISNYKPYNTIYINWEK